MPSLGQTTTLKRRIQEKSRTRSLPRENDELCASFLPPVVESRPTSRAGISSVYISESDATIQARLQAPGRARKMAVDLRHTGGKEAETVSGTDTRRRNEVLVPDPFSAQIFGSGQFFKWSSQPTGCAISARRTSCPSARKPGRSASKRTRLPGRTPAKIENHVAQNPTCTIRATETPSAAWRMERGSRRRPLAKSEAVEPHQMWTTCAS